MRLAGSGPHWGRCRPRSAKQNEEAFALNPIRRFLPVALLITIAGAILAGPATAQTTNIPGPVTVVSLDGLNLRAAPSMSATVLQLIPFGSVLSVTGSATADRWYPVTFGAINGWASGDYLAAGVLDPVAARSATTLNGAGSQTTAASSLLVPPLTIASGSTGTATASTAASTPGSYAATASYYGIDDGATPGRMMACGSPFDPYNSHAAATNDWACGTRLRVTSADGRSTDVVVTDHGQYPQHWIDLTYAAFGTIADHKSGVIQVSVQPAP
jgi:hypothetical protein